MAQFKSTIYIVILLAALFSGCVSPQATPTPTPTPAVTATVAPPATATPEVTPTGNQTLVKLDRNRGFIPGIVTISGGDEIVWDNYYADTVTLISSDGLFDARILAYHQQYRYIFKNPGTYKFYLEENKNLTGTIIVSSAIPQTPTPVPTQGELPRGSLYVDARMVKPAYWSAGNYSLNSLEVQIYNQQTTPLSIKAQIVSDGQVLEEKSFSLEQQGSSYQFTNERRHFMNSTNVTLLLLVQGYQPAEYRFKIVDSLG